MDIVGPILSVLLFLFLIGLFIFALYRIWLYDQSLRKEALARRAQSQTSDEIPWGSIVIGLLVLGLAAGLIQAVAAAYADYQKALKEGNQARVDKYVSFFNKLSNARTDTEITQLLKEVLGR